MRKHYRCPWCGRRVEIPSNPFKKTVCKWCGKEYYTYFKYIFGVVLCTPLLILIKPSSHSLRLAVITVVALAFVMLIPLARGGRMKLMRKSPSDAVTDIPQIYVANISFRGETFSRISTDDILLTSPNFDEDSEHSPAPIRVVMAKGKVIHFSFLYNNEHTEKLVSQGSFDVWRGVGDSKSKDVICTLEVVEGKQSAAWSELPFKNYGFRDIDESRVINIGDEGISFYDESGEKQIIRYSDCVSDEKSKKSNCIGECMTISELMCGVVIHTPDVWTRIIFSEKNRAAAMSISDEENRYSRRDAFVREIEKYGYKILGE